MTTLILSLCVALLEVVLPTPRESCDATRLTKQLTGRVLRSFVTNGMTEKQVKRVLGQPNAGFGFGPDAQAELWIYWEYDLSVSFGNQRVTGTYLTVPK